MKSRFCFIVLEAAALLLMAPPAARAQFDTPNRSFHNATNFPLEGKHQTVACEACHINGQYRATPSTCYSCHWQRRRDDPYQTSLGSQCEQCHRPISWTAVSWDHAGQAGVSLNADHRLLECRSCHKAATLAVASVECVSCHQRDFARTTSPNHIAAGFPATCEACHRPGDASWQNGGGGGQFNHAVIFPLVGPHATQACEACHINNIYRGTPRDCVGCHLRDYNRTANPNHSAAGFPTTCETCHRSTDPTWRNGGTGQFNHDAVFPLVGPHATQVCEACHINNIYRGTPRDCVGCHLSDYNRTANPNHAAAGFSTSCESCHRPTDPQWGDGAGFNHAAVFPLVGTHATQTCQACHVNDVYRGTARDCIGCHLSDYNRTANPNHAAAGFSTSCESCHRPTDPQWGDGAGFNHAAVFPLVGTHATQPCQTCHVNNVYRGTPRDCVGCHLSDYTNTRDPNHPSAGFPTTCDSCHRPTDSSWDQGNFVHSWFPLTGPHNRSCAQCHTTPNNYSQFSCTACHARGETDSHHREVNGYRYESTACFACHPNGRH